MRFAAHPARLLLGLLAGALLAACSGETGSPAPAPVDEEMGRQPPVITTPWRGDDDRILVSVWEMHCPGCEIEVEQALEPIQGVAAVRANWETSEVRVDLAEGTPRDDVIARIREAVHGNGRLILGEDPVER